MAVPGGEEECVDSVVTCYIYSVCVLPQCCQDLSNRSTLMAVLGNCLKGRGWPQHVSIYSCISLSLLLTLSRNFMEGFFSNPQHSFHPSNFSCVTTCTFFNHYTHMDHSPLIQYSTLRTFTSWHSPPPTSSLQGRRWSPPEWGIDPASIPVIPKPPSGF